MHLTLTLVALGYTHACVNVIYSKHQHFLKNTCDNITIYRQKKLYKDLLFTLLGWWTYWPIKHKPLKYPHLTSTIVWHSSDSMRNRTNIIYQYCREGGGEDQQIRINGRNVHHWACIYGIVLKGNVWCGWKYNSHFPTKRLLISNSSRVSCHVIR